LWSEFCGTAKRNPEFESEFQRRTLSNAEHGKAVPVIDTKTHTPTRPPGQRPSVSKPPGQSARGALPNFASQKRPDVAKSPGYFEATRSADALELIRTNPLAYTLAAVIAHRARWRNTGFNPHGLQFGEAFLGDFENYGMTERGYRTAKKLLAKGEFAAFKVTNRGTLAKLIDTRLFKINPPKGDGQGADTVTDTVTDKVTTNLNLKAGNHESDKAYSTKPSKLSAWQRELADRIETALRTHGNQWTNDAGKWINRIKSAPGKCERVIAEVESAMKERRIKTTSAPYAEQIWKEFAP
jgi:hypothetical protein